jgi:hypothetical protein
MGTTFSACRNLYDEAELTLAWTSGLRISKLDLTKLSYGL